MTSRAEPARRGPRVGGRRDRARCHRRTRAPIAERLLADRDVGIRARTVKSVGALGGDIVRSLQKVADEDDHPDVRALAVQLMPH